MGLFVTALSRKMSGGVSLLSKAVRWWERQRLWRALLRTEQIGADGDGKAWYWRCRNGIGDENVNLISMGWSNMLL
jgi:hypothetical protein